MRKEQCFSLAARQRADECIHVARSLADRRPGVLEAFDQLVQHVRQHTLLLRPARDPNRLERCSLPAWLLALALHHADWLRPVEQWRPPRANPTPQFALLVCHLLSLYSMPAFMTSAWFQVPPDEPHPEQEWYKHLGRGGSIRTAGLPLPFTRAMGHHFTLAPAHYSIKAALRWAQVRGMGGAEKLAAAIAATRLGREFAHEDFWATVVRFFVNQPRVDSDVIGPIVDFLHHQRCEPREVFIPGQGMTQQGPTQPDYSMQGRTVAALLRQVEQWRAEMGRNDRPPRLVWGRSSIGEYLHVEGTPQQENVRCWTIRELLTDQELFREGEDLRHCVAIYARSCHRRQTTIWSLQVDVGQGPHRALTIEVDPQTREICQARGKGNRQPRPLERAVMERWAAREELQIGEVL